MFFSLDILKIASTIHEDLLSLGTKWLASGREQKNILCHVESSARGESSKIARWISNFNSGRCFGRGIVGFLDFGCFKAGMAIGELCKIRSVYKSLGHLLNRCLV